MHFNLLSGQTTDTTGSQPIYKPTVGGLYFFAAQGTWDGATITLEYSVDTGVTWIPYGPDVIKSANGPGYVRAPDSADEGFWVRASQTSSGASTDLSCGIWQSGQS